MTHIEPFYLTKRKRKLTGKRLETFDKFWVIFNYFKGKAEAADSWLDIPTLTDAIVDEIYSGAKSEANGRQRILDTGGRPKWAQGWLTARRWEDQDEVMVVSNRVMQQAGNGVDVMVIGYGVLCDSGEAEFRKYCKETDMPPADIECVIRKHSGKYDHKKLAQGIGG